MNALIWLGTSQEIKGYGTILTFLDEHLKGEKKMKE
jgi:hypothetical protein